VKINIPILFLMLIQRSL